MATVCEVLITMTQHKAGERYVGEDKWSIQGNVPVTLSWTQTLDPWHHRQERQRDILWPFTNSYMCQLKSYSERPSYELSVLTEPLTFPPSHK